MHETESLSNMTVLDASTEDLKQVSDTLLGASGEESVPLRWNDGASSAFQCSTTCQVTTPTKPEDPPSFGISQGINLTWPSRATDTLYNSTPESQPTKVFHFLPRMSGDIPFNFQSIDPEIFYDPRSVQSVVRQLATLLHMGHAGEARAFIDKLDSFLVLAVTRRRLYRPMYRQDRSGLVAWKH